MHHYIILIGVADNLDLVAKSEGDRRDRRVTIVDLIFSFGPAWVGSQSSVLLHTDLRREEIVQRLSPLLGHADFVGVMEIDARSVTAIGWNPDEEGLDALYPDVEKWGVAPSGSTYRQG